MTEEDPFGPESHDKFFSTHSKKQGHYCLEFDGLWICQDCDEFDCCDCFGQEKFKKRIPPIGDIDF